MLNSVLKYCGLWLIISCVAVAQPLLTGSVIKVVDGDTIKLKLNGKTQRIRLDSIDAPEKHQSGGIEAAQDLKNLLPPGSSIKILSLGQDRYQRTLAQLYLPDGTNINERQVKRGQAWVFIRYCRDLKHWLPLQDQAKQKKLGLWRNSSPLPPWEFRHPKSRQQK